MTTEITDVAATQDGNLQDKFHNLRRVLQTELIERAPVIDTSILSLISGLHHFQLGEPGVAKSYLMRAIERRIDGLGPGDSFEILLTRFTSPEEVFGPYDLNALEESRFARNTTLMAPEAKFWMLDEVFKSNSSLLNAFLWALNERLFRNEGQVVTLPLWCMFCASNELPEGEELNALYDRIHFRHIVRRIQETSNFVRMLTIGSESSFEKVLSWKDVQEAAAAAARVEISGDALDALAKIRSDLRNEGIEPTDRRFRESLKVIRSQAWLEGEEVADVEHLTPLTHMLWTTPDELPKVEAHLLHLANPLDVEALALLETVDKLADDFHKIMSDKDMDPNLRNKKGVELHTKVDRARNDLNRLTRAILDSKKKSTKIEEVRTRLSNLARSLLKEIFDIEVDEAL